MEIGSNISSSATDYYNDNSRSGATISAITEANNIQLDMFNNIMKSNIDVDAVKALSAQIAGKGSTFDAFG